MYRIEQKKFHHTKIISLEKGPQINSMLSFVGHRYLLSCRNMNK